MFIIKSNNQFQEDLVENVQNNFSTFFIGVRSFEALPRRHFHAVNQQTDIHGDPV